MKLDQFQRAIDDCVSSVDLNPKWVKGFYLLGQSCIQLKRWAEASSWLMKAYLLAIEQKTDYILEILTLLREARKQKWYNQQQKHAESQNDLLAYISGLVEKDRQKLVSIFSNGRNIQDLSDDSAIAEMHALFDSRLHDIHSVFYKTQKEPKMVHVPDAMIGKISFETMLDPVISPSGISYDRTELLDHFQKIGHFDPLSRQPITEKDLIPNLALKDLIDEFITSHGWALDY